jgi:redox-sensing transcriptional repressor
MIVKNTIKRLLQYRMCLVRLREMGLEKVYSYTLGREAGVTAEQVRKDFSEFEIRGKKKGGYSVNETLDRLNDIFKKNRKQDVILVGMGNIGTAFARYECGFMEKRKYIAAAFDIDPSKYRKNTEVPVLPMEEMPRFIRDNRITVAIIAVPGISAQDVCNQLVSCGIRGIMNFAPIILKVPPHIVIDNINLCNVLEGVMYCAEYAKDDGE